MTIATTSQPGDTAPCLTCGATCHHDFATPADRISPATPAGWRHLRSLDPRTLLPIEHGHAAAPDLTQLRTIDGTPRPAVTA